MKIGGNRAFSLGKVMLKDEYLLNAFEKEIVYLKALDTDKLLAGFRETAGVNMRGAERYGGWESMLIGGHTLGHYMSACVRGCESVNCNESDRQILLQKLYSISEGLKECQEAGKSGFLFGAAISDPKNVESQFDCVEENKTDIYSQAWVPWYTMHKVFEGLVSAANMDVDGEVAANIKQTACMTVSRLADWVYARVSGWSEETRRTVLGIEYGGMNDCLYDVYLITGKEEHLQAAHAFDEVELFEKVRMAQSGDHILDNHHANTTIPKFLGALKRYVAVGEDRYLEYAAHFWELVTQNHTYITGGNSEWEHFGKDQILNAERTNCNCETCNAYNMLKMTKLLFMITGDVKYANWYETTYVNSILASQNPETGMTTYFQPMASGYFKVYGTPFDKFWCCIGTGMENFTKLQESYYFEKEDTLIVNQYISSSVAFRDAEIIQCAQIPKSDRIMFDIKGRMEGNLMFRLPDWLAGRATILKNGEEYEYQIKEEGANEGYAWVEGPFEAGTQIELVLPMKVVAYNLPDQENTYAFKYGPVVLSALLGNQDMIEGSTGVDVTIPEKGVIEKSYVPSGNEKVRLLEHSVSDYMKHIDQYLVRRQDTLFFDLKHTDAPLTYVPHYMQHTQRYGIYFEFMTFF